MAQVSKNSRFPWSIFTVLSVCWLVILNGHAVANAPRVLPTGQTPKDARLGPLKDLNGYFPFDPPETKSEWQERSLELRRRILVATGLWPMPTKTPLNAVIHGKENRKGFTVEKVYFESYPGHFVTGLLFRPKGKSGSLPAVLCPHGHGGRLMDYGKDRLRQAIAQGAERFEDSGRFPKIARCAQLARMGCVSFIFDMVGYADSVQITRELAHRFQTQRPEFDDPESWGFFSTQAELRMQSIMGLQTYNSVRALDFLCDLPDVDSSRVGVTGGSGGGTQTILLGAIDPRPIVTFPQGMVSTAMQGGCTCENCSLLRIGTGNVELAGLFAPKPIAMTAADDWTKDMQTKGYPQLQQLYAVVGVKENVYCKSLLHFPHNYNYVTRNIMYQWMNKHLNLGLEEPVIEEDFPRLSLAEMAVWNDQHPKPAGGPAHERALTKWMDEDASRQLAKLIPKDAKSLTRYREVIGGAFETILGRSLPSQKSLQREKVGKTQRDGYLEFTDLLRNTVHGEELPVVSLYPTDTPWNGHVVICLDGRGKDGLFQSTGLPIKPIRRLLAEGASIVTADLCYQGEFLADGAPLNQTRTVKNTREFAGYTYCYNQPLLAQRVHDILTLIAFVSNDEHGAKGVHLVGASGAGTWVSAAGAVSGEAVDSLVVDSRGFRFSDLNSYRDVNFLPGAIKYGGLASLMALSAPTPLLILSEDDVPSDVRAAYDASGERKLVSLNRQQGRARVSEVTEWLIGQFTSN